MKTLIATTALALSVSAPAFADTSNVAEYFAMFNDSAAETTLGATSVGDTLSAERMVALYNESPAETKVIEGQGDVSRSDIQAAKAFFALNNDSAAERIVK